MPRPRKPRHIYVEVVMGSVRAWLPSDPSVFFSPTLDGARIFRGWRDAQTAAADAHVECDCVATPVMR